MSCRRVTLLSEMARRALPRRLRILFLELLEDMDPSRPTTHMIETEMVGRYLHDMRAEQHGCVDFGRECPMEDHHSIQQTCSHCKANGEYVLERLERYKLAWQVNDILWMLDANAPETKPWLFRAPPVRTTDVPERLRALLADDPKLTQRQAASLLDVSERTVREHWPRSGAAEPAAVVGKRNREAVAAGRAEGKTQVQIAKELGVAERTVQRHWNAAEEVAA